MIIIILIALSYDIKVEFCLVIKVTALLLLALQSVLNLSLRIMLSVCFLYG